jgi:D-alanyl-D-alanine carboxypeptidase
MPLYLYVLKRVAFDRPHATRFRLLFMHVVIAKPLHTFARHASDGG